MLVPSSMSLFNNATKILCRYYSNKREKRSSTNLLPMLSLSGSLQPVLSLAQDRKGNNCHTWNFLDNADGFRRSNLHNFQVARKIEKFEISP